MQDQVPLSVAELFILNLFFGSVTLVFGVVILLVLLAHNKKLKMSPAFSVITLFVVLSPVLSFLIFAVFFNRIDLLFGPFHLQTAIAVIIIGLILTKSFKLTLKRGKPKPKVH